MFRAWSESSYSRRGQLLELQKRWKSRPSIQSNLLTEKVFKASYLGKKMGKFIKFKGVMRNQSPLEVPNSRLPRERAILPILYPAPAPAHPRSHKTRFFSPVTVEQSVVTGLRQGREEYFSPPSRRSKMLNALFAQRIADHMAESKLAKELMERGLEVTEVDVATSHRSLNIFWICISYKDEDIAYLEEHLRSLSFELRSLLIRDGVLGKVPQINFAKDYHWHNLTEVMRRLQTMDLGPEEEDADDLTDIEPVPVYEKNTDFFPIESDRALRPPVRTSLRRTKKDTTEATDGSKEAVVRDPTAEGKLPSAEEVAVLANAVDRQSAVDKLDVLGLEADMIRSYLLDIKRKELKARERGITPGIFEDPRQIPEDVMSFEPAATNSRVQKIRDKMRGVRRVQEMKYMEKLTTAKRDEQELIRKLSCGQDEASFEESDVSFQDEFSNFDLEEDARTVFYEDDSLDAPDTDWDRPPS
ncbi:unnamed protein product [Cyprideis torosa]|uniref:Uncharacterized protein n=1 Tax=Cyprideis torosa TaxID=163714 RepID=A0A7R8ZHT2_9CRUS|nr:unnamed protein product [Cyprideis torosa]CAG0884474.1 unnamed protein product [Cyprideis torosa]